MKQAKKLVNRFLMFVIACSIFLGLSLLIRKPQGELPLEFNHFLLQALVVGTAFALSLLYFTRDISSQRFARRMYASILLTFLVIPWADRIDMGRYLGINNPILSSMFLFWVLLIAINCVLQSLQKLLPSSSR